MERGCGSGTSENGVVGLPEHRSHRPSHCFTTPRGWGSASSPHSPDFCGRAGGAATREEAAPHSYVETPCGSRELHGCGFFRVAVGRLEFFWEGHLTRAFPARVALLSVAETGVEPVRGLLLTGF